MNPTTTAILLSCGEVRAATPGAAPPGSDTTAHGGAVAGRGAHESRPQDAGVCAPARRWPESLWISSMICAFSMRRRTPLDRRSEEHTSELQSRGQLGCRPRLGKTKQRV